METLAVVRKVTQDVLLFVCYKQELIAVKPSPELSFVPEITPEFFENLSLTIWIDSNCNEFIWERFFWNHFSRITASPYRFANYVSYACYLYTKNAKNAYDSFGKTLSLIIHFGLHCWHKGRKEFLSTCVDLFCDFFEKEILTKFLEEGGWKNFNKHIADHEHLKAFKEHIEKKEPLHHLYKTLEDEHREKQKTSKIGDVLLKDITESKVLDDKQAASFADSVVSKMEKLVCKQTIKEIIADFKKTDRRVEELYRQMAGEATGGTEMEDLNEATKKVKQSPARKEKDDNIKIREEKQSPSMKGQGVSSGKTGKVQHSPSQKVSEVSPKPPKQTSGKQKKQKAQLQTPERDSLKSQDVEPEMEDPGSSLKITKVEKAKSMLLAMLEDFKTVHEFIKFLCIETPI